MAWPLSLLPYTTALTVWLVLRILAVAGFIAL
jgi:hypothetical protein